ncbi:hypothetical protein [Persicobacter psychrovividus]|uniref:Uncharacterized protein n=1 Tax=Persicobacter psychrovividus TaxID=387638 RepID=A0ABM7VFP9_9BACT|nr:hypothetical protein PEPS_20620 [Persicobacter psychrovividus]
MPNVVLYHEAQFEASLQNFIDQMQNNRHRLSSTGKRALTVMQQQFEKWQNLPEDDYFIQKIRNLNIIKCNLEVEIRELHKMEFPALAHELRGLSGIPMVDFLQTEGMHCATNAIIWKKLSQLMEELKIASIMKDEYLATRESIGNTRKHLQNELWRTKVNYETSNIFSFRGALQVFRNTALLGKAKA